MSTETLSEMSTADVKAHLRESLSELEVLEGVLPTQPLSSRDSRVAIEGLGDRETLLQDVDSVFAKEFDKVRGQSASTLFAGTQDLREQLSAFASAGIGFFYADEEILKLPMEERSEVGANGAVTRVLTKGERVFLETQSVAVQFEEGVDQEAMLEIIQKESLVPVEEDIVPGVHVFSAQERPAIQTALALMEREEVAFAEPDFIEQIGIRFTPTDREYPSQWHQQAISCETAWNITKGAATRLVVIDNGFDVNHADLRDRLGSLSGWFRDTPDKQQADFVPGTANIPRRNHGTACAGMAGGRARDSSGGVGIAFETDMSVIACLNDQVGTQATLAKAIGRAYLGTEDEPGADVIVCSLGPSRGAIWELRTVLRIAIENATIDGRDGLGCPIFWATSNGNVPVAADQVCSHPDVIAVGRSTDTDSDHGSAFGPDLDFLAPGVDVWLPQLGGGFHTITGTSFAAPAAAGVAALVLSARDSLSAGDVRDILRSTCDKVGALPYIDGRNVRFGFGRVNAEAALTEALNRP